MSSPTPTRKAPLAGLAVAGLALLALLGRGGPVVLAGLAVLVLVVASSYAEAARAGREIYRVRVERSAPQSAGEGVEVEVVLRARYLGSDPPSYIVLQDHPDRRLRPEGETGRVEPRPGEWVEMAYTLRPAPGLSKIRAITIVSGDPLGLFTVRRTVELSSTVIVSPSPLHPGEPAGSGRPGKAEYVVAAARGVSTEFYQLREYVPGDDVRLIHWPTTARTGVPMVREGPQTLSDDVALLLDLSAPSWPGTPGEAPADWIMRTALYIASSVAAAGGRVWATILRGEYWEEWDALRGRDAAEILSSRLSRLGPDTAERKLGLERAVSRLARRAPAGAWTILLLGPATDLRSLASALASAGLSGCRVMVALFTPLGGSRLEELVRTAEEGYYRRAAGRLRELGVRSVLVTSHGGVVWVAREAARLPLSRSC